VFVSNTNSTPNIYTIDKFGAHITKTDMIKDIITRYSLSKDKTVMIGDAPSDVISAHEAGITSVGVMWGYGTDKTNLIKNSDKIMKSIGEFYNF
ncbi:MAG: HAD hydrolase-like protein, partial [Candidatus Gastranaerophilales bacterium]|nr:HAD hydrolase-like protein [Candidatus Gastranaerophilales bacterium]